MRVLHITPETDGYEEVTLISNRVSEKNGLALIEKDGQRYMTGGYLVEDNKHVRNFLDGIPKEKHFALIREMLLVVALYLTG